MPDLLASLDDDMLPNVDQSLGNLFYTVVMGETLGSYELEPEPPTGPDKHRPKGKR